MTVAPYLSFDGRCEEAFTLYARCLGGTVGALFRYGGSPMAGQAPAEWVMHGSMTIGDLTLSGADAAPGSYTEPSGFSLSIEPGDADEAERVFNELAAGGRVLMPLQKTFWAERFGTLVDRFGIAWMINFGPPSA